MSKLIVTRASCGKWKARNGFHFRNLRYAAKFLLTRVTNEIKGVSWLHIWQREQNICPCTRALVHNQARPIVITDDSSGATEKIDCMAAAAMATSVKSSEGNMTFIPCPHWVLRPHLKPSSLVLLGSGAKLSSSSRLFQYKNHKWPLLQHVDLCQTLSKAASGSRG